MELSNGDKVFISNDKIYSEGNYTPSYVGDYPKVPIWVAYEVSLNELHEKNAKEKLHTIISDWKKEFELDYQTFASYLGLYIISVLDNRINQVKYGEVPKDYDIGGESGN